MGKVNAQLNASTGEYVTTSIFWRALCGAAKKLAFQKWVTLHSLQKQTPHFPATKEMGCLLFSSTLFSSIFEGS